MKQYIKDNTIKTRQQIVIVKDGMRTINPSEEQILKDGWVEYVVPTHSISEEQKAKAELVRAKHKLRNNIITYDSSPDVNTFFIQGKHLWLNKATRSGLMLRFQSEIASGKENTTLWYNGERYEFPTAVALEMLYSIEIYASQCYDVTQFHLATANSLTTIEEVNNYDYTTGYPSKLEF